MSAHDSPRDKPAAEKEREKTPSEKKDKEKGVQVYIGKLPRRITKDKLEKEFRTFGKISDISIKQGYAFITFDEKIDADEAISQMNGKTLDDQKIVVEPAGQRRDGKRSRGPQPGDKCYRCHKQGHWANECRERSPGRGRYRGRSHTRSHSRKRSRSRSEKKRRSRSRSHERRKSRSKSRSRSRSKSKERSHSRKRSVSKDKKKEERSKSRESEHRHSDKKGETERKS